MVKLLDPSDPKNRLDRYELIGELASGGMATVFLARLAGAGGFQRLVAIKRLHPHLAGEEEFIQMFLDEARLAAGMHHPNVVPILEVGRGDSGYYLVMEYIEGDTLARVLGRSLSTARPAPRPILTRILLDALAGLHAAHELVDPQGRPVELVHRDCSPQNILVGVDGSARLTDFGVARATSRLTVSGADRIKGKLAYMSPEQAMGQSAIDRRSDLFAMGVILWEVFTGKRLFKADNEGATLMRLLNEPIPRLASVITADPALDVVAARALERDPQQRFQTAADMADALELAAKRPGGGGVASSRQLATYIQAALGNDMTAQRDSVRSWMSKTEMNRALSPAARQLTGKAKPPPFPGQVGARAIPAMPSPAAPRAVEGHAIDDDRDGVTQFIDRTGAGVAASVPFEAPSSSATALGRSSGEFQEPTPSLAASADAAPRSVARPARRGAVFAAVAGAAALLVGALYLLTSRAPVAPPSPAASTGSGLAKSAEIMPSAIPVPPASEATSAAAPVVPAPAALPAAPAATPAPPPAVASPAKLTRTTSPPAAKPTPPTAKPPSAPLAPAAKPARATGSPDDANPYR